MDFPARTGRYILVDYESLYIVSSPKFESGVRHHLRVKENEVLQGLRRTIERCKPMIIFESWSEPPIKYLERYGYGCKLWRMIITLPFLNENRSRVYICETWIPIMLTSENVQLFRRVFP
jgi:hypothetical protein